MTPPTLAAGLFRSFVVFALLVACGEVRPPVPATDAEAERFVAHGGGAVAGALLTNSLEALDESAARGYRYIEIDLSWTSDGRLVLLHDWEESAAHLEGPRPGSAATFLATPLPEGRTPLDLDGALDWLERHPSVWLVTDVKTRNVEALRRVADDRADLRSQIVPQVHDPVEAEAVAALGFDRIILTLYASRLDDDAVLRFAAASRPFAVTIPWRRALEGRLPARLGRLGIRSYAHTVNDFLRTAALREHGLYGVYTDILHPDEVERSRALARLVPWQVRRENGRPLENPIDPYVPSPATAPGVRPWLELRSGPDHVTVPVATPDERQSFEVSPESVTRIDVHRDLPSTTDPSRAASAVVIGAAHGVRSSMVWAVTGRGEWRRGPVTMMQDVYRASGSLDGLSILGVEMASVGAAATAHVALVTAAGTDERRIDIQPDSSHTVTFALPRRATGDATLVVEGRGLVVRSYGAPATLAKLVDHR